MGRVLSTLNEDGSRRWIDPRLARGRFLRRRLVVAWGLIAVFVVLPYVRINGHPAILLDIIGGKFHILGGTFLATDTLFLMLALICVFVGIFLVTAVFGRVWCGWACPQTVYLEFVFRPLERWFKGGRAWRRPLRYPVYAVISLLLAHVFLSYFVGVDELARWMRMTPAQHPVAFAVVALVTGAMFFDFAWFREQTCLVACPYGRLQSVLLDRQSLIVGYDETRGEPRGKGVRRRAADAGDCVDCGMCVTTCPTGIDIRDGLQMECIGCTQCIDACDAVMDRIGKPRGLIRYSSKAELAGEPRRLLRPRVVFYPLIMVAALSALVFTLIGKTDLDVTVLRTTGSPFELLPDGDISNRLRVKVTNRSESAIQVMVEVVDPPEARILSAELPISLAPDQAGEAGAFVIAPRSVFSKGRREVTLRITHEGGEDVLVHHLLLGPEGDQ